MLGFYETLLNSNNRRGTADIKKHAVTSKNQLHDMTGAGAASGTGPISGGMATSTAAASKNNAILQALNSKHQAPTTSSSAHHGGGADATSHAQAQPRSSVSS